MFVILNDVQPYPYDMIHLQLKKLRLRYNLSQEQLAEELRISQPTYARLENGSSNWAKYLENICDYFKVKPTLLFSYNEGIVIKEVEKSINDHSPLILESRLNYKYLFDQQQKLITILERQLENYEKRNLELFNLLDKKFVHDKIG
jgi:transcriptional regulator with XRE-family HTH domain